MFQYRNIFPAQGQGSIISQTSLWSYACLVMAAFCGKYSCMLLKNLFFFQSVEIKFRKLELLLVVLVERRLQQALAQALHLFRLPFPISKHWRALQLRETYWELQRRNTQHTISDFMHRNTIWFTRMVPVPGMTSTSKPSCSFQYVSLSQLQSLSTLREVVPLAQKFFLLFIKPTVMQNS